MALETASPEPDSALQGGEAKKHLRGSSLLLVGRLVSVLLNFATQVLIVRYLTRSDYGSFAYAMALVSMGSSLAVFGMDKSASRFLAIFQEQGDSRRALGTLAMMTATVVALGGLLMAILFVSRGFLGSHVIKEPETLTLCLIMAIMAPLLALDSLFGNAVAVFAGAKAVFFRRHLLGPLLQLGVVGLMLLRKADVVFLATGYALALVVELAVYPSALFSVLKKKGLLAGVRLRDLIFPAREVFSYTLPLLSSDVVYLLRSQMIVLFLGFYHHATDVAAFRAVFPVARLNMIVFQSFIVLYTPALSRLFTRGDTPAINALYWQTAGWIALISFPIFAVTCTLADPLTLLLFGERYADAGLLLAVMAFGHYVNAALGFNGQTLQACGKVRFVAVMDLAGAAISVVVSLILIPRWGALGAAWATCVTLVLQNLLYQLGLKQAGVEVMDRRSTGLYGGIILGTLVLIAIQAALQPAMWVGLPVALFLGLLLLRRQNKVLELETVFPELMRVPGFRRLLNG